MDIEQARDLAIELMREHGLEGWTLMFDRSKRRAGSCNLGYQRITLSRPITELNDADHVRDTILHEIAHAKVGPTTEAAHGPKWRAMAASIGAAPKARGAGKVPPGKWQARCDCPGKTHHMHRKPKNRYACRRYRSELHYAMVS